MITTSGNKKIDNAIIIGVIILIAYFVYKAIKTFSNPIGSIQETLDITPDTELLDPSTLPVNPANLTHPKTQFDLWATQLYEALFNIFDPAGIFADRDTIRQIMYQINSDDDLKQIIKSYGTQTALFGLIGGEGNLVGHLKSTMSDADIKGFNDHFAGWNMKLRL